MSKMSREWWREYREKNREKLYKQELKRRRKYQKDPAYIQRHLEWGRQYGRGLKLAAFDAYGGQHCALCPEVRINTLTIDHINGGGTAHRNSLGRGGNEFYRWLKREGYPPGYRVLCMNCNHLVYVNSPHPPLSQLTSAVSKRKTGAEIKLKLMGLLGGECAVCGIDDLRILTVHHINGGGNKERRKFGGSGSNKFYRILLKQPNLNGYQCRCFSCNCSEDWND